MSIINVLAGIAAAVVLGAAAPEPGEVWQQETRKVMPAAARFEKVSDTVWTVRDAEGGAIGKLMLEGDVPGGRKFGFAGFIDVALLLDARDRVAGVLLGGNHETPRFLDRVVEAGFLRRWNALPLAAVPEQEVDVVTSATYSSGAIRYGVRQIAARALKETCAESPAEVRAEIAWIERRAGRIARRRAELAAAVESLKARGSEAQEELAAVQRELQEYETMMREIEARLQTLKRAK